jgi:hypothetical protein
MLTHFGEESSVQYDRRRSRKYGVYTAPGTESGNAIFQPSSFNLSTIDPILDLAHVEDRLTVEAPSTRATGEQIPIPRAKPVY